MNKLLLYSILITLLILLSNYTEAQTPQNPNAIGVKVLFLDYFTPNPGETAKLNDITNGFEVSYLRNLTKNLDLVVPLRFAVTNLPDEYENQAVFGIDATLRAKYYKEGNLITPYLYAGGGYVLEKGGQNYAQIPGGLGLNFGIWNRGLINAQAGYRYSTTKNRNNLELGLGFIITLGKLGKDEMDSDKDGVPDATDQCPKKAGSKIAQGCPDKDNDGIPDKDDDCPNDPGTVKGCPDKDGDGVADKEDECPDVKGLAEMKGCPKKDSDGDGVPDEMDKCPNEAGTADRDGCPNVDHDGDGIIDGLDDCPTAAGTLSTRGCPDMDNDGVADKDDACPNQAGASSLAGCPDSDGDGIADRYDNCPNLKGLANLNGCPDTDNDGVADPNDKCPDSPGSTANFGCPEINESERQILDLATRAVQFETGKATLKVSSYEVLDQIAGILNKYPGYRVSIAGHTDSVGNDKTNKKLSEERAKACYDYLLSKAISNSRISYVGYGETQPIATNDTVEGRSLNRRVEFNLYIE